LKLLPPDVIAKMYRIRFHWGSLQRSPCALAGFKGPTYKRRERRKDGKEEQRKESRERRVEGVRKGRGGEEDFQAFPPVPNLPLHR